MCGTGPCETMGGTLIPVCVLPCAALLCHSGRQHCALCMGSKMKTKVPSIAGLGDKNWAEVRGVVLVVVPLPHWFLVRSASLILFTCGASSVRQMQRPWSTCSCPCSGSLAVALRFVLFLSWQRLWIVPALWAGHRALSRSHASASQLHAWPHIVMALYACALARHMPQVPCLGICSNDGVSFHSQGSTFAGSILLVLVFTCIHGHDGHSLRVARGNR